MVAKETFVYLFIGCDIVGADGLSRKHACLNKIKETFIPKKTEDFNTDTLYSRDLTLKDLQEKLLCLPIKSKRRVIVVKDAQVLKEDIKEFILGYARQPQGAVILVLDFEYQDAKNGFVERLYDYAKTYRFKENASVDTFVLSRSIDRKDAGGALSVLNRLFENGEKPEWILGGLRFACEKRFVDRVEAKKRLKLFLDCDINIKTGKLKPVFALEKLIVDLCGLGEFLRQS